jgi:hypothetical protein
VPFGIVLDSDVPTLLVIRIVSGPPLRMRLLEESNSMMVLLLAGVRMQFFAV